MNETTRERCRTYLDRLANQIDYLLPPSQVGDQLPLERLPTIAGLVREYIEAEAILAGLEGSSDQQTND